MTSPLTYARLCAALVENSPGSAAVDRRLRDTIAHAAGNPGKLVRARLVLAAASTHHLDDGAAERLACSVEYFHLASLLIDDLPCMDDASTRRGLPCAHRLHGEAATILAALAFINRAYALASFAFAAHSQDIRMRAAACLDACLGPAGLVGGQAADLAFAESDRSAREVSVIASRKTVALFWLAVYYPALLASPSLLECQKLKALCIYWGLAYQAADDLQDALLNAFEAGKTTGRDRLLNRPNLAHALGIAPARARIVRLLAQASRVVGELAAASPRWSYLAGFHRDFVEPTIGSAAA